jgi:hypothetical protein
MSDNAAWNTPTRVEYLRREYTTNPRWREVDAGVRAIEGPPVLVCWATIQTWCKNQGMRRPPMTVIGKCALRTAVTNYRHPVKHDGTGRHRKCLLCRRGFDSPGRYIFRCELCRDAS